MELVSQTSIVHYIEYQFECELNKAKSFLDVKDKTDLYDNNGMFMMELTYACNELLEKNSESYIHTQPVPDFIRRVDAREPLGELIDYCIETLDNEGSLELKKLKSEVDEAYKYVEGGHNFSDEQLLDVINAVYIMQNIKKNQRLEEQDDIINSLKTSIKLVDNTSNSNIFRQSFINVFSIFDAYVFERLEKYFYSHPSEIEKFLDEKNSERIKITYEDVIMFSNIDDLKRDLIQKQLNGKYLSAIIRKLKKYKPTLFEDVDFRELMEMIERRNIHLHNKGYVDQKYYNSFNIYRLNVGDYAYIDNHYLFIKVFNVLSHFATNFDDVFALNS